LVIEGRTVGTGDFMLAGNKKTHAQIVDAVKTAFSRNCHNTTHAGESFSGNFAEGFVRMEVFQDGMLSTARVFVTHETEKRARTTAGFFLSVLELHLQNNGIVLAKKE
jgi:hypothetical protein